MVNRHCGGGKLKYVPKFWIGYSTGRVISRMHNDNLHWKGALEPNISKKRLDRGLVAMDHGTTSRKSLVYGEPYRHVIDDVT